MLPRRKGTRKLTQVVPSLAAGSHRLRFPAGVYVYFDRCTRCARQQHYKAAFSNKMVVWSGGPSTPAGTKVFDGTSNRSPSTCLKTPQSEFLEEAEAVPAESNGPQWKTI